MNSEWSANVRVAGTVTEPRISGDAELIRGTYDFAGRRFDLIRGNIRFQGEAPVNPQLDIAAEARGARPQRPDPRLGRSQRPEIAFTSTPALPQDELLSRILFGTSITNLSAPEAVQLASAVASLNDPGGGLDPINALPPLGRARPASHPPRRRHPGHRHPARRRQISRPARLCGGGHRRARLFGDDGRISDHPLALLAVEHLDDRPRERQRARLARLLTERSWTTHRTRRRPHRHRLRNIVGGSAGNLVEWYDWYIYAAFSLYFAPVFFPGRSHLAADEHRRDLRGRLRHAPDRRLDHGHLCRSSRPQGGADAHRLADVPRLADHRPTPTYAAIGPAAPVDPDRWRGCCRAQPRRRIWLERDLSERGRRPASGAVSIPASNM